MHPWSERRLLGAWGMGEVISAEDREGYMERAYARAREYQQSEGRRGTQAAHEYVMQCGSVWIDGVTKGNVARYINDSKGSRWVDNARLKQGGQYGKSNEGDRRWGASVVTTKRVAAGEEIFYAYGPEYWKWRADKQLEERGTSSSRTTTTLTQAQPQQTGLPAWLPADDTQQRLETASDDAQQLHDGAERQQQQTEEHGIVAGSTSGASSSAEKQQRDTPATSDLHACMVPADKSKGKHKEKSLVDREWGEVRRARAKKASDAYGAAVRGAREERRAARRGEAAQRGDGSGRRRALGAEVVEGEHEGKRRRLRQAGRDGTGTVPDAVT